MADSNRHYCQHAGCGKSFQRPEHLRRHQLNHTDQTMSCPRCQKLFYRNDLLQRHLTLKHGQTSNRSQRKSSRLPSAEKEVNVASTNLDQAIPDSGLRQPRLSNTINLSKDTSDDTSNHSLQATLREGHTFSPERPELIGPSQSSQPSQSAHPTNFGFGNSSSSSSSNRRTSKHNFDLIYNSSPFYEYRNEPQKNNMFSAHETDCPVRHVDVNIYTLTSWQGPPFQNANISAPLHNGPYSVNAKTYTDLLMYSQIENLSETPLATLESANRFLSATFMHISSFIPIFHTLKFTFNSCPRELFAAFTCVGLLTCKDTGSYESGCNLLRRLRNGMLSLLQNLSLKMEDLWIVQTMLLIEISGLYYADRISVDLSDIFHDTLVTLAVRLELFGYENDPPEDTEMDVQERWLNWIDKESSRRLAYSIFVLDVQQALLFGHTRKIISPFAVRLPLPCSDSEWFAPSGVQWLRHHNINLDRHTKFNGVFHSLLSSGTSCPTLPPLSMMSCYYLFNAVSATVIDASQRRNDPFYLGHQALSRARVALEVLSAKLSVHKSRSHMKKNAFMTHHLSCISMSAPLWDIERAVNPEFPLAALGGARAALVRFLAQDKVGQREALNAVMLLKMYLPPPDKEDTADTTGEVTPSPFEPSGLYLGTLTLWAYILDHGYNKATAGNIVGETGDLRDNSAIWQLETSIMTNDNEPRHIGRLWHCVAMCVQKRLERMRNSNARRYSNVIRTLTDSFR